MPKSNAVALLKQDHQNLKQMLMQLSETTERSAKRRTELLEKIAIAIQAHTTMEEEIFYPAFHEAAKKRDDEMLYFEAVEEHHAADVVLADVKNADPASMSFAAKAKVLKEIIEHHIGEEEKELFPKAKQLLGEEQLAEIGQRLEERQMQLMQTNGRRVSRTMGRATNGRRSQKTRRAMGSRGGARASSSRAASAQR